jgi:hypothetical protein
METMNEKGREGDEDEARQNVRVVGESGDPAYIESVL